MDVRPDGEVQEHQQSRSTQYRSTTTTEE